MGQPLSALYLELDRQIDAQSKMALSGKTIDPEYEAELTSRIREIRATIKRIEDEAKG